MSIRRRAATTTRAISLRTGAAVPSVRARVASGCNLRQPAEVMRPAFCVAGALLGSGQARMGQPQERPAWLLDQVDLDQTRSWRHRLAAVPAKAVGQSVHWHDLAEGTAGEASPGDVDEIESAGLWFDLRLRSHPAQDLFWIGEEGEHRGGGRRDVRLAADDEGLFHRGSLISFRVRLDLTCWR